MAPLSLDPSPGGSAGELEVIRGPKPGNFAHEGPSRGRNGATPSFGSQIIDSSLQYPSNKVSNDSIEARPLTGGFAGELEVIRGPKPAKLEHEGPSRGRNGATPSFGSQIIDSSPQYP